MIYRISLLCLICISAMITVGCQTYPVSGYPTSDTNSPYQPTINDVDQSFGDYIESVKQVNHVPETFVLVKFFAPIAYRQEFYYLFVSPDLTQRVMLFCPTADKYEGVCDKREENTQSDIRESPSLLIQRLSMVKWLPDEAIAQYKSYKADMHLFGLTLNLSTDDDQNVRTPAWTYIFEGDDQSLWRVRVDASTGTLLEDRQIQP